MVTPWPKGTAWPTEVREHATYLNKYLRDALLCVEEAQDRPVPANIVKSMILGVLSLVAKTQTMPDVRSIQDALNTIQLEARTTANIASVAIDEMRDDMENMNAKLLKDLQESVKAGNEAKTAASEATEVGRTVMAIVREMKSNVTQNRAAATPTYAAMASKGLATSIHNTQHLKTTPKQTQREIIVNIKDSLTIANLRAMNPRNLKAHIDHAIEQILSSNQLRSGDLSIKTATTREMETLKQFTGDWTHRIGNGAYVRLPTYGILVHGIRTNSVNLEKIEDLRNEILMDNKPFIPNAEIKFIGWLSRKSLTKSASSIIIEFTEPEDANKIIDEGLIWQGQVFQCELARRRKHVAFARKSIALETALLGPTTPRPESVRYAKEHTQRGAPNAESGKTR
ncbi:hypothetical protein F5Y16DRAFT_414742 [Xylariaceae sp. FL0255]|nr:hypothetical protein F5Y16DRAFT_414742 [Xylariaceae sp. FL0255]